MNGEYEQRTCLKKESAQSLLRLKLISCVRIARIKEQFLLNHAHVPHTWSCCSMRLSPPDFLTGTGYIMVPTVLHVTDQYLNMTLLLRLRRWYDSESWTR